MHYLKFLIPVLFVHLQVFATDQTPEFNWDVDRLESHCGQPGSHEPIVTSAEFPFTVKANLDDLAERYDRLYHSDKRLAHRLYFDPTTKKVIAPIMEGASFAEVDPRFVASLSAHIEQALKRTYAHYAFFSDMGHSHYYLPQAKWDREYSQINPGDHAKVLTRLMADPDLKIFYHTAEQLTMLDEDKNILSDRMTQWRYYTRNIIGDNNGKGALEILLHPELDKMNTVNEYDDHADHGGGVYIHANENGCFSYQHDGQTYYFDLSYSYFPSSSISNSGSTDIYQGKKQWLKKHHHEI